MAAVILFSLPQAALLPLMDRDEPRFAEASREMVQSGNLIVPTFDHAPRYNKPPMIYWCQSLAYIFFGQNAFAARLPSILATAGTAFILLAWGEKLGSRCIGMIAGLGYAFCFQTMQQGRVATADGLLIFFMTLTAYTGWRLLYHEPPPPDHRPPKSIFRTASTLRAWTFRLVLALAGGFLAKGPEAWLPLLPMLVFARNWQGRTYYLLCFLYSLFLVSLWAVPAYYLSHGAYAQVGLNEGLWQRIFTGLQGHGASSFGWYVLSLPLYLLIFWISALPWSPLLLTHCRKLFAGWKPDVDDRYLLLNAGLIFVIFSLMVTKLPHYTLPAFPFLLLLLGRRWNAAGLSPVLPTRLCGGLGLGLAILTIILVPVAMMHNATPSPVGALVKQARAAGTLKKETVYAFLDFTEPTGIWEMRRISRSYGVPIGEAQVNSFLAEPESHAVVLSTELWKRLAPQDTTGLNIYEARGFNVGKGKFVDLTLVVNQH